MHVIDYRHIYALAAIRSSAPNPIPVAKGAILYYMTVLAYLFRICCEYGGEGDG